MTATCYRTYPNAYSEQGEPPIRALGRYTVGHPYMLIDCLGIIPHLGCRTCTCTKPSSVQSNVATSRRRHSTFICLPMPLAHHGYTVEELYGQSGLGQGTHPRDEPDALV